MPEERSDQPTRDDRTPQERLEAEVRARFANHSTWESGGSSPADHGPPPPPPGGEHARDRAGGRYVVQEEIGRGGMGRVVAAEDRVLGRTVAVKEALTTDPDTVRRFARETEITARLEHPAIVPVYDAGVDADGMPYYVMRKLSGQPLERLVDATRTLAERLALLPHVVAAAQAMAHAHRHGVLHRDLKPSNILVGEFGETVVIDWGLAKVADEAADPSVARLSSGSHVLTQAGAVFGTPGFMSPEQIAGATVDARGDVYALGATLYFLLARRSPHHADTAKEIMALAAAGPPTPIAELVPGVPRDLAWIVDTALAYDPERRFPHAGALAAELKNFLTGQLVASRHYTWRERLVRFVRRHRIAVTAVAVAAIVLGFAVSRVVIERGRARAALAESEQARHRTEAAYEQLRLDQAQTLLATNPTAAVVAARPLARSPRWREVRAIAAAARYAGACVGLPGPLNPRAIMVSPGGHAATTSDQDGMLWYHDLDRRTSRPLIQLHGHLGARAAFVDDDRLVAYDRRRLALVEIASGAARELREGLEVETAAATRDTVFVVTADHRVHRLALDGSGWADLGATDAHDLYPSPDGRWLAVATDHGLLLFDLAAGGPPVRIVDKPVVDARWSGASMELTVHIHDRVGEILLVTVDPAPAIVERSPAGQVATHLPLRGHIVSVAHDGLHGAGTGPLTRNAAPEFPLGLTRDEAVVVGRRDGLITIIAGHIAVELHAPSDDLLRLATSPASPYVLAAISGRLLVWNTEELLPIERPVPSWQSYWAVGPRRLLLGSTIGQWEWYDLDTGATTPFVTPSGVYEALHDGSGELAVLRYEERAGARGFLVARYGHPIEAVETEASAIMVRDRRITIGTPEGEVLEREPASRATAKLAARPGQAVIALGGSGRWRSALWADGTLWRRGPDGREERGALPAPPSRLPILLQRTDGRVCAAAGRGLACWNTDGSSSVLPPMALDIDWAELLTEDVALVSLADGGVYQVDLATGNALGLGVTGGILSQMARGSQLVVSRRSDDRVAVIDLAANAWWPLNAGFFGATQGAMITPDGERVAVLADGKDLLLWRLTLPQTPEATARWLDELTNAIGTNSLNKVGWR